jgi:hypothetical protein
MFSGQTSSPPVRKGQQRIINEVEKSIGKIAYISKAELGDRKVKILFSID